MSFHDEIFKQYSNTDKYTWYNPYDIVQFPSDQLLANVKNSIENTGDSTNVLTIDTLAGYFIIDNTGSVSMDTVTGENLNGEMRRYIGQDIITQGNSNDTLRKMLSVADRKKLLLLTALKTFIDRKEPGGKKIILFDFCGNGNLRRITEMVITTDKEADKLFLYGKILDYKYYVKHRWSDFFTLFTKIDEEIFKRKSNSGHVKNELLMISDFLHEPANKHYRGVKNSIELTEKKWAGLLQTKQIHYTKFIQFDNNQQAANDSYRKMVSIAKAQTPENTKFDELNISDIAQFSEKLPLLFKSFFCTKVEQKIIHAYTTPSNNGLLYDTYSFVLPLSRHKPLLTSDITLNFINSGNEPQGSNLYFRIMVDTTEQRFNLAGNELRIVSQKNGDIKFEFRKFKTETDNFKLKVYREYDEGKDEFTIILWKKLKPYMATMWLTGITIALTTFFGILSFFFYRLSHEIKDYETKKYRNLKSVVYILLCIAFLLVTIIVHFPPLISLCNYSSSFWQYYIVYFLWNALNIFLIIRTYKDFKVTNEATNSDTKVIPINGLASTI